ncbi:hypothetical protein A6A06_22790 [Streptomyces sp. CB02923]|uniref:hypothetical protein n=1 Tax=Streptomyces sp. CB02923 TaxID=1718985 RepID=UPI00093EED2C|nr:hypothetical protein [Streptomyces sp. CB02923]OKH99880.1 hypothetical protein A6A06_22790 [Streptomyces sp. CB02923]
MTFLRGFFPWIAYGAVAWASWQWAALLALVIGCVVLYADRAEGLSPSLRILEYGSLVFFAGISVLALLRPDSGLRIYDGALSSGWLALVTWGSMAARRPFTLAIARRKAPPEVWRTSLFLRINYVLTAAWAASFTFAAAGQALVTAYGLGLTAMISIHLSAFVIPLRFTASYPERARARFLEKTGGHPYVQEARPA